MINFSPVNFLGNIKKQITNYNQTTPKIYAPKLAPLSADCVSFTGARSLNHTLYDSFQNETQCKNVADNAQIAKINLQKTLNRALGDFTGIKGKKNNTELIESIKVRIKTPESIREKVVSVLEDAIINHIPQGFINPNDEEDIKNGLTDIVGARIVLKTADPKKNADIIKALIDQIKCSALKVKKIDLMIAEGTNATNYPYFEWNDLKKLESEINKIKERNGENPISIKPVHTKTGYTGLHIDVDLTSDNKFMPKYAGYSGEIQILGSNVAEFKELEDLCYKVYQDKDIKGGDVAYLPFQEQLKKQIKDKSTKEAWINYTKEAYIIQVQKDTDLAKGIETKSKNKFPSIADCSMQGKIPSSLDFNILNKFKVKCDELEQLAAA